MPVCKFSKACMQCPALPRAYTVQDNYVHHHSTHFYLELPTSTILTNAQCKPAYLEQQQTMRIAGRRCSFQHTYSRMFFTRYMGNTFTEVHPILMTIKALPQYSLWNFKEKFLMKFNCEISFWTLRFIYTTPKEPSQIAATTCVKHN